jgi:hypothetical protein
MRIRSACLAAFLFVAGVALAARGGDELVTLSDGRTLVLHDDYTWSIKGGKSSKLDGEITVNVYGDKNIVLHEDKSWDFADSSGQAAPRKIARLTSVSATATAARATLDEARETARTSALGKIADQLRPKTDTLTVSRESLIRCAGLSATFATVRQGRTRDSRYTVSLRTTLSREQIDGVLSCASEPAAP